MLQPDQVLVHGIFSASRSALSMRSRSDTLALREKAFREHAEALGICSYECFDGSRRSLANRMLRRARGTAPAVDAVEIIALNRKALQASLAEKSGRALWQDVANLYSTHLDRTKPSTKPSPAPAREKPPLILSGPPGHGSTIVDPGLVPEHADLATGLEDAMAEYVALCKTPKKPRKKKASRAKTKKKVAGSRL